MYVYVGFYGDFDPHELLNLLAPRGAVLEVRQAGEPLRFAPKMAECDSLKVKIAKRPTYDLEGLLDELQGVSSAWAEAGAWAQSHALNIFLRVVAEFDTTAPALVLRPDHLAWLLSLGATVDMDVYRA